MERAANAGLAVEQKIVLKNLGLVVTRLRVPKKVKAKDICTRLTETGGKAQFDLNHYYGLADTAGRKKVRFYPKAMIGWPLEATACGSAARIGMVDTGIAANISALERQQILIRSFTGAAETSPADHGTDIATILVGKSGSAFPGLMPNAKLYAANVFSIAQKTRLHTTAVAIAKALNWLISVRVQVINLSLTGPDNKLLKTTVQRTLARHIFLVAAAGNAGPFAPPVYPAAYHNVIAVTAIDRSFRLYRWANRGKYITFAAPGVHIWLPSTDGRGQWRDGTSYASAFCTALVAQLAVREGRAESTNTLIRLIREHSTDLGTPGKDDLFGWGLIHNWMRCNGEKYHAFQE
ncbi:MAG: S8 family serine peptidase [Deltaproteobacteria bacterium]|nr:S8 family serine peptidase [Deltaproteobacteria bacterium]